MRDLRFVFVAALTISIQMFTGHTALSFECKPGEVLGPGRIGSASCTCRGQKDCDDLLASEPGKVCKTNFECAPDTDVCGCPIGPSFNLHATHDAFCRDYATKAVRAAKENVQLRCGNVGPRWSANFKDHDDWCRSIEDQEKPQNAEEAARASALQTCRTDVRAREEAVQKPGVPIGDIVKPVDPLDKLGVVKKPNEGVDQFLKQKP